MDDQSYANYSNASRSEQLQFTADTLEVSKLMEQLSAPQRQMVIRFTRDLIDKS